MKIAIEGCCHGHLDDIYSSIADLEAKNKYHVQLLLICGDFQAIRNEGDLQCMAVPEKYKHLGGFYRYYTGEKTAPILTVIIGGNHEASNYFWELFHGGWVAPNIYYLGHAGSVLVNGIRIAGASGIFKAYNFRKGYFERQPYSKDHVRSVYHIRESAIRQLSLLPPSSNSSLTSAPTTIFLSHDWPLNITSYASPSKLSQLLRKKPHFREEVSEGKLGSPPLMGLLQVLKPRWWFSAHLHIGFDVRILWEAESLTGEDQTKEGQESSQAQNKAGNPDEIVIEDDDFDALPARTSTLTSVSTPSSQAPGLPLQTPHSTNPDEIMLDDLDGDPAFDVAAPLPPPPAPQSHKEVEGEGGWFTQFVALDKCLPSRKFLEVIDVDTPGFPCPSPSSTSAQSIPPSSSSLTETSSPESNTCSSSQPILTFDPHWLAITRAFHSHISLTHQQKPFPDEATAREMVSKELDWVKENINEEGKVRIEDVQQFVRTAPGPESHSGASTSVGGKGSGEGGKAGGNGPGGREQPPVYSNPQTEAFCRMLMVNNFVNRGALNL